MENYDRSVADRIDNGDRVESSRARYLMTDRPEKTETAEPEYRPNYKWRQTWPGESDDDFVGDDDGAYIGRIYRVDDCPTKGKWKWNGSNPGLVEPVLSPF